MKISESSLQEWEKRVRVIESCRVCGSPDLRPVIDLGPQCLTGLFDDGRPQNQLNARVPLEVFYCGAKEGCGFIQLRHTVPPDVMFQDYGYRSGINSTMRRHLEELAVDIESRLPLKDGDLLVDIGANDGTLLAAYARAGVIRVGFEPSQVRPWVENHGIHYIPAFFNAADFLKKFPGRKARVVTSIAMFYDIDDPAAFCRDIHEVLAEDGFWVVEMSCWSAVLDNNGFDAICHEHLGYYSMSTLRWLFEKTGFDLYDVSYNASNSGSIRCFLVRKEGGLRVPEENRRRVAAALDKELRKDYDNPASHERFRRSAVKIREDLRSILGEAVKAGRTVYGYGASTKGNVLLQYCGITPEQLTAIADRNPAKKGRWTPGSRIPICSEEEMRAAQPDLLLILPWHFLPEFLKRESALRSQGTRFIVPMPEVKIV